ncbi:hypothetical protein [Brevibacterium linens]|uniref:AAA domain-containing protein n=1 Tax=Brevibacterium linens TaxID=1703 RepID=A0A2H1IKN2_BRELN|nr:hypothetical protein [Brevibacterium linens]SMX75775.1 hypothetical protein BLIN101_01304 [Brevibacterium linens]
MTTPLTLGVHAETGQTITWGGDVPEAVIQVDGEQGTGKTNLARALHAEATMADMRTILIASERRARPGVIVVEGPVDVPGLLDAVPGGRETLVITDDIDAVPTSMPPRARLLAISSPLTLTGRLSPTLPEAAHLLMATPTTPRLLKHHGIKYNHVMDAEGALLWVEPARPDMNDLAVIISGDTASPVCCPAYAPLEDVA